MNETQFAHHRDGESQLVPIRSIAFYNEIYFFVTSPLTLLSSTSISFTSSLRESSNNKYLGRNARHVNRKSINIVHHFSANASRGQQSSAKTCGLLTVF